jgi:phosphohistidine phosphatase
MKTLVLVRHTKSSWKNSALNDLERPLKKSRLEDAFKVSSKLRDMGFQPDIIISSPAKRAFDTAVIFAKALSFATDKIIVEPSIYESSEKELLHVINNLDNKYDKVMIFGHNPCIENFLSEYTNSEVSDLPTTGAVWLEIDSDKWKINKKKQAKERHYFYPKMFKKNLEANFI